MTKGVLSVLVCLLMIVSIIATIPATKGSEKTSRFTLQKKDESKLNENITINVYAKQFTFGKFCVYIENYGDVSHGVNWTIEMPLVFEDTWVWNGTIKDLQPGDAQLISTDGFAFGLKFFDARVTVSTEDPNAEPFPFPFSGFLLFGIFIIWG
jgi:hypothetical protein